MVSDWSEVPMPMVAPTVHNPALVLDWMRFSSDTCVQYVKMQADLLHELTPGIPVTSNLRALSRHYDHFDMAEALDFVSLDTYAILKSRPADNAVEFDMMRSLKKTGVKTPDGEDGFWVIEQKAGNVNWQDVNSLLRPGVVRLFTYQLVSRGATGVLYFFWRSPRIGSEKFYGGVLTHDGRGDNRVYREISQIGEEMKLLAPVLHGTKAVAETCILFSHPNEWTLKLPMQHNRHFSQREHIMLFYTALHDRNIPADFAARHKTPTTWPSSPSTRSSLPRRSTCWPAAKPTCSSSMSRMAARSSQPSTPAWWTNTTSLPTPASRTT
jgi:beta-galactosidase